MTTPATISELTRWTARLHEFMVQTRAVPLPEYDGFQLQFEAPFNKLALDLYALQTRLNPAYAAWAHQRCPHPPFSWREIPAMPAAGFKELELSCLPPNHRSTVFYSSGTTLHSPSRHFHNEDSLKTCERSLVTWFEKHLVPPGTRPRMLPLTPPPAQAPHSSLVHMMATVSEKFGSGAASFLGRCDRPSGPWLLDLPAALENLNQAADQDHPVGLMGTAFNFVHLLDHLASTNTRLMLPHGSFVMETGGYKNQSRSVSKESLHKSITDFLAIPSSRIVGEYGMSELSSQAYDLSLTQASAPVVPARRRFRFPPWVGIQVISPEDGSALPAGQAGLLGVVDLANAWSVMAVQTEDLAARHEDGFVLLGRSARSEPRGCSLQTA